MYARQFLQPNRVIAGMPVVPVTGLLGGYSVCCCSIIMHMREIDME